jgi:hypothetical protein
LHRLGAVIALTAGSINLGSEIKNCGRENGSRLGWMVFGIRREWESFLALREWESFLALLGPVYVIFDGKRRVDPFVTLKGPSFLG